MERTMQSNTSHHGAGHNGGNETMLNVNGKPGYGPVHGLVRPQLTF